MAAADKTFVRIAQKTLSHGAPLLQAGVLAAASLLGVQAVWAQDGSVELTIPGDEAPVFEPAPVIEAPAPVVPSPVVPSPVVIEPVTPTDVVPNTIESGTSGATAVDYGTVFVAPSPQQPLPTLESLRGDTASNESSVPVVELVSPVDYGSAQVDPTDYGVGATMPDVVISERTSGCQFSVSSGEPVTAVDCGQTSAPAALDVVDTPAAASPVQVNVAEAVINSIPGVQEIAGLTTAASRDYYNKAAKAVVNLQLGEKFIFPLSMPAPLTSLFGWRMHPIFGAQRFHAGTDIGAPLGTPVVATQSGRVELADATGGYGLMVILRHHEDTLESRYAHLARLLVRAGEWVEQGEVIGLVGSTGNSTGPHLHFELRQRTDSGWAVLNPDALIKKTLGTLTAALGNSAAALQPVVESAAAPQKVATTQVATAEDVAFRPAQPLAN